MLGDLSDDNNNHLQTLYAGRVATHDVAVASKVAVLDETLSPVHLPHFGQYTLHAACALGIQD